MAPSGHVSAGQLEFGRSRLASAGLGSMLVGMSHMPAILLGLVAAREVFLKVKRGAANPTTHFKPSFVMSLKISSAKASPWPRQHEQKGRAGGQRTLRQGVNRWGPESAGYSISASPLRLTKTCGALRCPGVTEVCLMEPSVPHTSKLMSCIQRTCSLICVSSFPQNTHCEHPIM